MKLAEYNALKREFIVSQEKIIKRNGQLLEDGQMDMQFYDTRYMMMMNSESMDMQDKDFDFVSSYYDDLVETLKEADVYTNPTLKIKLKGDVYPIDDDAADLDQLYWNAVWYIQYGDGDIHRDMLQAILNKEWRNAFTDILHEIILEAKEEDDHIYKMTPDCKAMQMFEKEQLTWKGLVETTYGDCDLF